MKFKDYLFYRMYWIYEKSEGDGDKRIMTHAQEYFEEAFSAPNLITSH